MRRARLSRTVAVALASVLAPELLGAAALGSGGGAERRGGPIVVGSKNFAENRLLAEMFAQLLEARTELRVERRLGLAGTEFCFEALRTGAIDVYPEYTGTGWVTILGEAPAASAAEVLGGVRREFLERWNLWWLAPLGFENAYEIAVTRRVAERHRLVRISQLAEVAPDLRAGFGYEFVERADGLPGLREEYGLELGRVQSFLQEAKYQAAGAGEIDVLDVYTTDGRLLVHDLVVLEDDRGFFPPYEAAALVRGETLERHPEVGAVLGLLGGALDRATMQRLNLELQEEKAPVERVARASLADLGLLPGVSPASVVRGPEQREGWLAYVWSRRAELLRLTRRHVALTAAALLLGVVVMVPLALLLERAGRGIAEGVIRLVGTTQTIPSLALLGFAIPLLGVGVAPALAALVVYSLFPILRNTYTGLRDADPQATAAATALGMTPGQVLRRVQLPLALPTIMAGVRTAAVLLIGTATLAAFIGAGGLGEPIISGVQLVDTRRILFGAVPAALLAILADVLLGAVERALSPRGLRVDEETAIEARSTRAPRGRRARSRPARSK